MSHFAIHTLVVLCSPLLGAILLLCFGRKMSKSIGAGIGIVSVLASLLVSTVMFFTTQVDTAVQTWKAWEWISAGQLSLSFEFQYDQLTALFLMIITGIGFLIHVYSAGYMHEDEGQNRFFGYLNFFIFFMLMLVMGGNYAMMFIGWEGVGLCSYLLIGFWYTVPSYNLAAKKAFVMNRIGDLGLLIGMFMLMNRFHTLNFESLKAAVVGLKEGDAYITAATTFLFVGAMGKSAQIPLFTWLPDAMAGPTPVSALIHAATMVTAGIYLVVRSNFLFSLSPETQNLILVVGLVTALFAATIGLRQNDIKKVLAYSTVSQLGYMFIALGVGAYSTAFFHVFTHAFFKALLFLGAGSVIHALHHEQDIRKMGGLKSKIPTTFFTFLIGTIAISGLPPFAGFFSKDEILAHLYEKSPILWALGLLGSLMTAFYMFRLLFVTFFGQYRGKEHADHPIHESPWTMTLPLILLAIFSIVSGFVGIPEVFKPEAHWLSHYLSKVVPLVGHHEMSHSLELTLMGVSVTAVLVVIGIAYRIYVTGASVPAEEEKSGFFKLLSAKYYVDELYDLVIVGPVNSLSVFFGKVIDKSILDGFVDGLGEFTLVLAGRIRLLHSGKVSHYLFAMVIGVLMVLAFNILF